MKKGTQIRYKGTLGAMAQQDDARFVGTVEAGMTGTYLGKHPLRKLAQQDWHLTKADSGLFVPVHLSQFEEVSP